MEEKMENIARGMVIYVIISVLIITVLGLIACKLVGGNYGPSSYESCMDKLNDYYLCNEIHNSSNGR